MSLRWRAFSLTGLIVSGVLVVAAGVVSAQVYRVTHPPRHHDDAPVLTSVVVPVEEVRFTASDNVRLVGWLLRGDPGMPYVLMCHDLGGSKGLLLDLAVVIHKSGYSVLVFDLRGHGDSLGGASSLGIKEKHDVIGAFDFVTQLDGVEEAGVGVYGLGMGAHAAVLAAADRPGLKVLVLDGLYPSPSYPLVRGTYGDWKFASRYLGFLPTAAFTVLNRSSIGEARAERWIPRLVGRDVLMISPADDNELSAAMEAMFATIPEQSDSDGNLVMLPATRLEGLYGEELEIYENRVLSFFDSRLAGS